MGVIARRRESAVVHPVSKEGTVKGVSAGRNVSMAESVFKKIPASVPRDTMAFTANFVCKKTDDYVFVTY